MKKKMTSFSILTLCIRKKLIKDYEKKNQITIALQIYSLSKQLMQIYLYKL